MADELKIETEDYCIEGERNDKGKWNLRCDCGWSIEAANGQEDAAAEDHLDEHYAPE